MIGNPKWFTTRKYTGWGLTPTCWQGWAYIAIVALPLIIINSIPIDDQLKTGILIGWSVLFSIDLIDIFIKIKRDERDSLHEAIAERNAMWFMITALAFGVALQAATSIASQQFKVDPVILIALIGAVIIKAATNFYLRNK
jgi:hypothetical protein